MTRHFIRRGMLAALLSLSLAIGFACTVLMDARGNIDQGRTNEYPAMQPDELTSTGTISTSGRSSSWISCGSTSASSMP